MRAAALPLMKAVIVDQKQTKAAEASAEIKKRILSGVFAPGARINEVEISQRLGISRTPIRSGLGLLLAEGLLDYTPQIGFSVRSFPVKEIESIYRVRANLFGLAARLAAERPPPPSWDARLAALSANSVSALKIGDHEAFVSAWIDCRDALFELVFDRAGNAHLSELVRKSRDLPFLRELRRLSLTRDDAAYEHRLRSELLRAIGQSRQDRAAYLYSEIVSAIGARIIELQSASDRLP